jgi:glycine dehydrogenase subunit 1
MEVRRELERLASRNSVPRLTFSGAGHYQHYIPSAVRTIILRGEFITSYTPYQPEVSQGNLQALFEYQSLVAELTGMDAANSSMYDGTNALCEALLMARRIREGSRFLIPKALHRSKRLALEAYAGAQGIRLVEIGFEEATGNLDLALLQEKSRDEKVIGAYIEQPGLLGGVEERMAEVRDATKGRVLVAGADPLLLSLLRPPGEFGADIVVGDGGPVGMGLNLGGPLVGMFATTKEHVRKLPGRVVGATRDLDGRLAYCLTLQTREQHIRRSKATSNICTNQALCALASAVYLSLLGRDGLRSVARKCYDNAHDLASRIAAVPGFKAPRFSSKFFCEFAAQFPAGSAKTLRRMRKRGIQAGLPASDHVKGLKDLILVSSTEVHRPEDLEEYAKALKEASV